MKLNQDKIQRMFNGQGSVAGGGGSSFDPSVLFGLATEQWTEENYVSKTFFNELFVIHKLTTTVVYDENDQEISRTTSKLGTFLPNELPSETETVDEETGYKTVVTTAVDNIEAKKGLWTNFFMSALGLNDAGGGGGVGDVTWDALEDDTDYRQIALSHLTTALQNYATQTWVQTQGYVTQSAISDMATKTWVGQQGFLTSSAISDMATKTWVGQQGYLTSSAISDMATKTWVGQQGFITSVTGTFWGRTFTNGGTVTGTLESVQHIQMTGHLYMHYGGTGIYLNSDGTGIDWHDASNDYVSSLLAFTSGQVQFNQDAYIPASKILRLGDAVFEWDATNNAVKVRKATGANDAVNFYATGGVSALGYGPSGGGGTGDVTWDLLADNTDTRQIALSHLTTALSGYATTSQLSDYVTLATSQTISGAKTFTGAVEIQATTTSNKDGLLVKTASTGYGIVSIYDSFLQETPNNSLELVLNTRNSTNPIYNILLYKNGTSATISIPYKNGTIALKSELSDYLPLTGGTLTGGLTIEKDTTIYNTEGLLIKNEGNTSIGALWQSVKILAPSIPDNGGGVMGMLFGKELSTNNSAWFGYVHKSSNSPLNRFTIGFYGNDYLVNIFASGNVGIGTASPSERLEVNGNIKLNSIYANSSNSGIPPIILKNTGATGPLILNGEASNLSNGSYAALLFGYADSTNNKGSLLFNKVGVGSTSNYVGIGFYGNDNILNIQGSGNVGVGTTSPSYKLHVNGTFYANGNSSVSGTLSASSFIKDGGTSSQFLKADGSVDSNSYATASSVTTLQGYFTNGSANTAIKLQTARLIWGQSFDGSADIGAYNVPTMQFVYFINFNNANAAGYVGRGYGNKNTVLLCAYSGNDVSIGANNRPDDLYINTDGNVGIGTTSPSYKLSVNGDVSATNFRGTLIGNASSATKLETARTIWGQSFDGSANVDEMIRVLIATSSVGENIVAKFLQYTGSPFGLVIRTRGSDGSLLLQAQRESNNNETFNMVLNANGGNVGIGTSSPSERLEVNGNIKLNSIYANSSNSGIPPIILKNTGATGPLILNGEASNLSNGSYAALLFGYADSTNNKGSLLFNKVGVGSTSNYVGIGFYGNDNILNIAATKYVGVGTTTPEVKLHVVGNILACGSSYTANGHYVQIGAIRLVYNDSTNSIRVVRYDGTAANLYATGGISALGISGSADGTVSANLIPSTTGTYKLGSSSYGWREIDLSYNSSNSYTGTISVDSDGINLISNNGGYFSGTRFLVNGRLVVNESDDVYPSYALYVNGNTYCDGSISASNVINRSDMRLKDVLDDLKLDLQTIANAPLFKFTFRKGERRVMVGTSAQYWQVLLPETVFTDADGMLGLDYGVTALASAISLAREVSEHDRRIAQLEAENMVLRAEIKNLKAA